jgi:Ca-activated chloride channel family protein
MWKFQHTKFFLLYIALGVMCLLAILSFIRKKKLYRKLGDLNLIYDLIPEVSFSKRWLKFILWTIATSFLILGICNLQSGSKTQEVQREGADIVVCLDVSKSMLAEDIRPNRLTRATQALEKFIDRLKGDRLGMVVFAGNAYVQLPITTDYNTAKLFLNTISTDMVPVQGTNISEAITKATESFGEDQGKNKAIIIITDGEDHEENAIKLAEEANEKQIMINTIGVGSEGGVPIPEYRNGVQAGFKKDREGKTVVTKLNSKLLKEIAGAANGVYAQATNADIGLNAVMDKIEELDMKKIETTMVTDYEDQFRPFFYVAFFIFIAEFFISERVSRIWKKLNLFNETKGTKN